MGAYDRFTSKGKKASFKDMKEADESALHNSNMLNIVGAVKKTEHAIAEHEHYLQQYKDHLAKLNEYGENGDMTDTETVRELHQFQPKTFKARNW